MKHYSLPRDKNCKSIFRNFKNFLTTKWIKKEGIGVKCGSSRDGELLFWKGRREGRESWRVVEVDEIRSIDQHGYIDCWMDRRMWNIVSYSLVPLSSCLRATSQGLKPLRGCRSSEDPRGTEEKLMSMKKYRGRGDERTNNPSSTFLQHILFIQLCVYRWPRLRLPRCFVVRSILILVPRQQGCFPACLKIILPHKHFTVSQSLSRDCK